LELYVLTYKIRVLRLLPHLGLGTCLVAWFIQDKIRPILNIPDDKYVVGIITLGYANETPKARPRKGLEEITHYESW